MASQRLKRTLRGALTATAVAAAASLVAPVAHADPQPTPNNNASEAVKKLNELSKEAEAAAEQWHKAKDDLGARKAEQEKATADVQQLGKDVEQAKAKEAEFRVQVDKLTNASFQGARFNQLSALLVSDSPQDFLDQMSALELLANDNKQALDKLAGVKAQSEEAERKAKEAQTKATKAAEDAAKIEADLAKRKQELDAKVNQAKEQANRLTSAEKAARRSTGEEVNVGPGSGKGYEALQVALRQRGKSYVWGATGPDTFDCSGLVVYAFRQVGVQLKNRATYGLINEGSPVSRSQLQPGDMVFTNNNNHMGIYVGDNKFVHAPTEGDVVKVSSLDTQQFYAARRV
ncbi:C40 family peptidase [Streptoalloteichus hindustanus]|uniref:Cell wall-associated hydrolase, NlpC family n=1 Tax=Streptoalloteichus hindustanus TaxID=2017 RepID=A0A1M5BRN6_STRHI|nr:C40 family peptidase [Streptoalloteichus hindustanus]SHF45021.1 Cell wall-associated hydrolase, NlpC family [Streptoalloteichus hindustanus]